MDDNPYQAPQSLTEAAYLLRNEGDAVEKLLTRISSARLRLLDLAADDVSGISAILRKYADQSLDLADATLMHLSRRPAGLEP